AARRKNPWLPSKVSTIVLSSGKARAPASTASGSGCSAASERIAGNSASSPGTDTTAMNAAPKTAPFLAPSTGYPHAGPTQGGRQRFSEHDDGRTPPPARGRQRVRQEPGRDGRPEFARQPVGPEHEQQPDRVRDADDECRGRPRVPARRGQAAEVGRVVGEHGGGRGGLAQQQDLGP